MSDEAKVKLSKSLKGRVSPRKGTSLSEEQKQKISESVKLYWQKKKEANQNA